MTETATEQASREGLDTYQMILLTIFAILLAAAITTILARARR